jgi:hypothetical protein
VSTDGPHRLEVLIALNNDLTKGLELGVGGDHRLNLLECLGVLEYSGQGAASVDRGHAPDVEAPILSDSLCDQCWDTGKVSESDSKRLLCLARLAEVVSEVDLGEVRIDLCRHLVMMA